MKQININIFHIFRTFCVLSIRSYLLFIYLLFIEFLIIYVYMHLIMRIVINYEGVNKYIWL